MKILTAVLMILFLAVSCEAQLVKPSTATSSTDQTARDTANAAIALARTKVDTSGKFKWEYTSLKNDSLVFLAGTGITMSQSLSRLTISAANVPGRVPAYGTDTTKFLRNDSSWATPEAAGLGDITAVNVTSPVTGGGLTGSVTIGVDTTTYLATIYDVSLKSNLASPNFSGTVNAGDSTYTPKLRVAALSGTVRASTGSFSATASDTVGLAVALAAKALASVTLTASTGLSGGGTLAANRTFAIDTTSLVATDYDVSLKANLASPTFTGTPLIVTDTIATRAYARSVGGTGSSLDTAAVMGLINDSTVLISTASGYEVRDSSGVIVNGKYHTPQILLASITLDSSCQFLTDTTQIGYVQYKSVIDTIILYSNSTVSLTPRFLNVTTPVVTSPAAFTTARSATRISTFNAPNVAARSMLYLVFDAITTKATKFSVYIYGHPAP